MVRPESYKRIVVTQTVEYLIPMYTETTSINGWTPYEVAVNWFEKHNINSHHATRDTSRVGGSISIVGFDVIDEETAS